MNKEDIIEEKYDNYINGEADYLELTIEEAKHILANDKKIHYVEKLLQEAYKVVLNELDKKDKVINEMAEEIFLKLSSDKFEYGYSVGETKEYFTKKVEDK